MFFFFFGGGQKLEVGNSETWWAHTFCLSIFSEKVQKSLGACLDVKSTIMWVDSKTRGGLKSLTIQRGREATTVNKIGELKQFGLPKLERAENGKRKLVKTVLSNFQIWSVNKKLMNLNLFTFQEFGVSTRQYDMFQSLERPKLEWQNSSESSTEFRMLEGEQKLENRAHCSVSWKMNSP